MLKRMMTTILALVLSVSCFGLALAVSGEKKAEEDPSSSAAPVESSVPTAEPLTKLEQATVYADQLNELGLFKGTNKGYELEHTATRAQAVTLLLRLMGLEVYAQARPMSHPFTDLPRWCTNAVSYAYNSQLVNGTGPTVFSPNADINARAYLTLLLRALGYGAEDGLTWKNTYDFAARHALVEAGEYTDDSEFLRADLVILSHRALEQPAKGGTETMLELIQSRPAFTTLDNGFVNTAAASDGYRGGCGSFPGQLADLPSGAERPTWEGTESLEDIMAELNAFASPLYGSLTYTAQGILAPGEDRAEILRFLSDADGRVGVTVFNWRQGYASSTTLNQKLNLALEAFLYLSGDGEAAYALWSWLDAASIAEEGADTSAFGFVDVEPTAHGGFVELNDVRIELDLSDATAHTYWFDSPIPPVTEPVPSAKPAK